MSGKKKNTRKIMMEQKKVEKYNMAKQQEAESETVAASADVTPAEDENGAVVEEMQAPPYAMADAHQPEAAAVSHKLYIQYNDLEFSDELLFEAAVNAYCTGSNAAREDVKAVNLYVKPQEGKAYYVINGDAEKSGSIEL